MARAGLSTNGVLFGYGIETTAGTKPTTFKKLTRINSIGGIQITTESIDASALEDMVQRTIAGRGTTGGTFPVTVNVTEDTIQEWKTLATEYQTANEGGKAVWFNTYLPDINKSFFVIGEPPTYFPQPEFGQNSLLTVEMTLTIGDYKGVDTGVKPN